MTTAQPLNQRTGPNLTLNFLANLRVSWKIGLMVFVLFLGILGITFSAYLGLQNLRNQLTNIYDFMLIPIVEISHADTALAEAQYDILQSHSKDNSPAEQKEYLNNLVPANQVAANVIARYDTEWVTTASPEFTQSLREAGLLALQEKEISALKDYHTAYDAYLIALDEYLVTTEGTPDPLLANAAIAELLIARAHLGELIDINNQYAEFSNEIAQNAYRQALTTSAIVLAIAVVIGLIMSYLIGNSITTRLGILTRGAEAIQKGDLNQTIVTPGRDEVSLLGSTFNNMARQLQGLFATLEQRVADRTKALSSVAEISTTTSSMQNLEEMLQTTVNLTQRRFGLYHAHVFLYDEETDSLKIMACGWKEGDEHEGTHGTTSIPFNQEQSLVARAARTKKPVIVNDVRSDAGWLPNPLLPDTASELAVPLIISDKVIGVLDVQSDHANIFTDADADVQLTLSSQIAVSVQNIRQFENSQKVANDLGVVAQVGIATATITDIDQLLQEVVDLSKQSFNLYHAHIYMLNATGDALELAAGAGEVGRQMVSEKRRIPMDAEQSLVVRAARSQQGVIANDVAADPNFLPNPLLPETRAEMAVPMLASGNVIGVLDVQSETIGRFTDLDINIKTTLASQIAIAVQNARNFARSRKQAEREAAVNLIAQRIQSATSVESALQVAARELGHALGMKPTTAAIESAASAGERKADA